MLLLTESYTQSNTIILFVFAILVLILGIYVLYTARVMMKTMTPPSFLIPEQEIARIKEPEGYCKEARSKIIGVGITCILYGSYEIIEFFYIRVYMAKVIGAVILFFFLIWFFVGLSRVRTKYTT